MSLQHSAPAWPSGVAAPQSPDTASPSLAGGFLSAAPSGPHLRGESSTRLTQYLN